MLFLSIPKACFIGYIHSIPQRHSPDWIQRNTTITPPHPQPITTTTSTNHTPIAQPSHPSPASWQRRNEAKPAGFCSWGAGMLASVHEVDVHEVDFARSGKQGFELARSRFAASAGANEGGWGGRSEGSLPNPAEFAQKLPEGSTTYQIFTNTSVTCRNITNIP